MKDLRYFPSLLEWLKAEFPEATWTATALHGGRWGIEGELDGRRDWRVVNRYGAETIASATALFRKLLSGQSE